MSWLSLFSYRDVRGAVQYAAYPHLEWIGIHSREGALPVVAACLIGLVVPALGGLWIWRYSLRHFDRLIGRPTHS